MVEHGNRDVACGNEILRTVVGSGVHGIAIAGTDDHDEMGVFIEPREHVYGCRRPLDTYTWRTQPEGARSGPGDTDLVMYSLRHYLHLAAKGNPTALLPLWAPDDAVLTLTAEGRRLRNIRGAFMSQQAVHRFLGYMRAQHERMLGGGKRNRVPTRPELIEKYGWDVKYGSHALRLAYQGYEIALTGRLTLPLAEDPRAHVLAVKRGEVSREDVSTDIASLTATVEAALRSGTPLPEYPDWERIGEVSMRLHEQHWRMRRRGFGVPAPRSGAGPVGAITIQAPPDPPGFSGGHMRAAYEHGKQQGRYEAGG